MSEAQDDYLIGCIVTDSAYRQLATIAAQQSTTKMHLLDRFIGEGIERELNVLAQTIQPKKEKKFFGLPW